MGVTPVDPGQSGAPIRSPATACHLDVVPDVGTCCVQGNGVSGITPAGQPPCHRLDASRRPPSVKFLFRGWFTLTTYPRHCATDPGSSTCPLPFPGLVCIVPPGHGHHGSAQPICGWPGHGGSAPWARAHCCCLPREEGEAARMSPCRSCAARRPRSRTTRHPVPKTRYDLLCTDNKPQAWLEPAIWRRMRVPCVPARVPL